MSRGQRSMSACREDSVRADETYYSAFGSPQEEQWHSAVSCPEDEQSGYIWDSPTPALTPTSCPEEGTNDGFLWDSAAPFEEEERITPQLEEFYDWVECQQPTERGSRSPPPNAGHYPTATSTPFSPDTQRLLTSPPDQNALLLPLLAGEPSKTYQQGPGRGTFDIPPRQGPGRGTFDIPPRQGPGRGTFDIPQQGPGRGTFDIPQAGPSGRDPYTLYLPPLERSSLDYSTVRRSLHHTLGRRRTDIITNELKRLSEERARQRKEAYGPGYISPHVQSPDTPIQGADMVQDIDVTAPPYYDPFSNMCSPSPEGINQMVSGITARRLAEQSRICQGPGRGTFDIPRAGPSGRGTFNINQAGPSGRGTFNINQQGPGRGTFDIPRAGPSRRGTFNINRQALTDMLDNISCRVSLLEQQIGRLPQGRGTFGIPPQAARPVCPPPAQQRGRQRLVQRPPPRFIQLRMAQQEHRKRAEQFETPRGRRIQRPGGAAGPRQGRGIQLAGASACPQRPGGVVRPRQPRQPPAGPTRSANRIPMLRQHPAGPSRSATRTPMPRQHPAGPSRSATCTPMMPGGGVRPRQIGGQLQSPGPAYSPQQNIMPDGGVRPRQQRTTVRPSRSATSPPQQCPQPRPRTVRSVPRVQQPCRPPVEHRFSGLSEAATWCGSDRLSLTEWTDHAYSIHGTPPEESEGINWEEEVLGCPFDDDWMATEDEVEAELAGTDYRGDHVVETTMRGVQRQEDMISARDMEDLRDRLRRSENVVQRAIARVTDVMDQLRRDARLSEVGPRVSSFEPAE